MRNAYLFIGDHKYWLMTPPIRWTGMMRKCSTGPLSTWTACDFVIQDGDSGMSKDYPSNPALQG